MLWGNIKQFYAKWWEHTDWIRFWMNEIKMRKGGCDAYDKTSMDKTEALGEE